MSDPAIAYDEERKWTYADYKEWELKPDERFELINGIAYAMAGPNTEHQIIASTLNGEFYIFLKEKKCQVISSPIDVRLFYEKDESDDTVVQPDLVVVCDSENLGKEGVRGAPNLVIEILSPSNTVVEMHRKLELYESAEVPEYWVIDPEQRIVEVYRLDGKRYVPHILRLGENLQSPLFPGLVIPMNTIFKEK